MHANEQNVFTINDSMFSDTLKEEFDALSKLTYAEDTQPAVSKTTVDIIRYLLQQLLYDECIPEPDVLCPYQIRNSTDVYIEWTKGSLLLTVKPFNEQKYILEGFPHPLGIEGVGEDEKWIQHPKNLHDLKNILHNVFLFYNNTSTIGSSRAGFSILKCPFLK